MQPQVLLLERKHVVAQTQDKVYAVLLSCIVCGKQAAKKCGRCKLASYCSKEHQLSHWNETHRQTKVAVLNADDASGQVVWTDIGQVFDSEQYDVKGEFTERVQQGLSTRKPGQVCLVIFKWKGELCSHYYVRFTPLTVSLS